MAVTGRYFPSVPPKRSVSASTKWESWRILASTGSPRLDTGEHLLRERVVLERAGRAGREGEDRFSVGRALFQTHALGDDGLEELVSEDAADLVLDVLGDDGAFVVERDHDTEHLEARVCPRLDLV